MAEEEGLGGGDALFEDLVRPVHVHCLVPVGVPRKVDTRLPGK
jgi:hypothetical protein